MNKTKAQLKIDKEKPYFKEWLASKVDPEIIALNVEYYQGRAAQEALLGNAMERIGEGQQTPHSQQYATTPVANLLNRYSHIEKGGWFCSGVDVLKEFKKADWGCFKPNEPRFNRKGKPIKYEHPPNENTQIFALDVPDSIYQKIANYWEIPKDDSLNFWEWVKTRPVPLFITEGAKKAGALLSAGFPAIALPGINNGIRELTDYDEKGKEIKVKALIPHLNLFNYVKGREIIFVFDQDEKFKTQKDVAWAIINLGNLYKNSGCEVSVLEWDAKEAKGIDDLIASKGEAILSRLYSSRTELFDYQQAKIRKVKKFSDEPNFQDFLRENEIDKRLKYNELTLDIELDGEVFDDFDYFKSWFMDNYSCSVNDKDFLNAISYFAKNNGYHPVKQYLEGLENVQPVSLDDLSSRYFGTKSDLDNQKVKRWLIGSVARVLAPTAVDFAASLILYGREQGMGKSRFFQTLGGEWHTDDIDELKGRDNALKQHRYWILEVAEFDQITNKKEAGQLKAWISTKTDTFREPFGRKAKAYRRKFAIAATVNEVELIKDETGSRRFWIIDTGDRPINFEQLATERDGIWAAAVQAYKAGEKYWFDRHELRELQDANAKFEAFDDWQAVVEGYIEHQAIVTTADILLECFKIDLAAPDYQRQQRRVTKILTKLRFTRFRQISTTDKEGKPIRPMFWIAPDLKKGIDEGQISENDSLEDFQNFTYTEPAAMKSAARFDFAEKHSSVPSRGATLELEPVSEVAAIIPMTFDEKNNFQNSISEAPDDLTEGEAISRLIDTEAAQLSRPQLMGLIKQEQVRLGWDSAWLSKMLKLTFPGHRTTKTLSEPQLLQFYQSLLLRNAKTENGKT